MQNKLFKYIKPNFLYFFILSIFFFFYKSDTETLNMFHYYDIYDMLFKLNSEDYFVYFFFFFYNFNFTIYLLGVLLTMFSIFFIYFYLSIKLCKTSIKKNNKINYFLRKQYMVHQTKYKPSYRSFQIIVSKRIFQCS